MVVPWRRRRPKQRSGAELLVYIYLECEKNIEYKLNSEIGIMGDNSV